MRAFLYGLLLLFFILWTALGSYIYSTIINPCPATTPAVTTPAASSRLTNLHLTDGNTPILEGYEQFAFDPKSTNPILTVDNERYLKGVADYLTNNPDKTLDIMGYYRPSEEGLYEGHYENLGLARAHKIKQLLVDYGIDADRMGINYELGEEELLTPIGFKLNASGPTTYDNTDEQLSRASYRFDNMVFSDANFESSSSVFIPSQAFLNWADSVQVYLAGNPEKTLTIIGHTDKTGRVVYNQQLGLDRAKAAKSFFESKGVTADIKIGSKGEKQPIATNTTPEGRQRNRRVNFILE